MLPPIGGIGGTGSLTSTMPASVVDNIAKQIPNELNITLDKALKRSVEFKALYDSDEATKELIDLARETDVESERKALYEQAMGYVLDLAIELPVYQRSVLYAYNSKVIDSASLPAESEMNPYSSPLDRIWEVEFAK